MPSSSVISLTPWGGDGGSPWGFELAPGGSIIKIDAVYGAVIDKLVFTVKDGAGDVSTIPIGGTGGVDTFSWTAEVGEYLVGIGGTHGVHNNTTRFINTMTLKTNKRTLTFGNNAVDVTDVVPFSVGIMNGAIVGGFHGRSGIYINSIGLYLRTK